MSGKIGKIGAYAEGTPEYEAFWAGFDATIRGAGLHRLSTLVSRVSLLMSQTEAYGAGVRYAEALRVGDEAAAVAVLTRVAETRDEADGAKQTDGAKQADGAKHGAADFRKEDGWLRLRNRGFVAGRRGDPVTADPWRACPWISEIDAREMSETWRAGWKEGHDADEYREEGESEPGSACRICGEEGHSWYRCEG